MSEKDPFKLGAQMGADIMAELEALENADNKEKTSPEDGVKISKSRKGKDKRREKTEEEKLMDLEVRRLRIKLNEISKRDEFAEIKEKKKKTFQVYLELVREYQDMVIKQAKQAGNIEAVKGYDPLESFRQVATVKNDKIIGGILEKIRTNMEPEIQAKKKKEEKKKAEAEARLKQAEEEKKKAEAVARLKKAEEEKLKAKKAEPDIELTPKEKDSAVAFFDKEIFPSLAIKKDGEDSIEFLKEQFTETAKMSNFLDGEDLKIAEAWESIASDVKTKVEALEKESQEAAANKGKEFTLEEVYARLQAAGADDEDINYFFSLHKKDRLDFLMSDDEELKLRIEKLKETRKADEEKKSEAENFEATEKLKRFGEYMKSMRTIYLQKEYEFNKTSAKMKRFFRMENVDMGNSRKELDDAKKDYREAVENYIKLIVQTEGIADAEDSEIMLNYFNVQEALEFQEEKMQIKHSNDPETLQWAEDLFGRGLKGTLKGYKKATTYLSSKAAEFVGKKTDSKILKFAGGAGGGMAFSVGLSNIFKTTGAPYWAIKATLLATSTASRTLENKEKMDKELEETEIVMVAERKLKALEEINLNLQGDLKAAIKKVFVSVANESLDYQEGKEARNKKMWTEAFGEAAWHNIKWFSVGFVAAEVGLKIAEISKSLWEDFVIPENNVVKQTDTVKGNIAPEAEKAVVPPVAHPSSAVIHSQNNFPPSSTIVETVETREAVDPILKNEAEIRETLEKMKKPIVSDIQTQVDTLSNELTEDDSVKPESETFNAIETPVGNTEFTGIVLDESGKGDIYVKEDSSMRDTVAKLLADNHEKLTQGKMGWNPDKYASVEEWANKRAIGIVGEYTGGSNDFDKISIDSKINIDMSNPADIRITDFVDGQDLNGDESAFGAPSNDERIVFDKEPEESAEIKTEVAADKESALSGAGKETTLEDKPASESVVEKTTAPENTPDIRENAAKIEIQAASRIGIDPKHYAEINHMSTTEFITEAKRVDNIVHGGGEDSMDVAASNLPVGSVFSDDEMANTRMGRVLDYLMRDGKIENPNQSIAETLRGIKQEDLMGAIRTYEGIFGTIEGDALAMEDESKMYSEYMSALIQSELKDMINDNAGGGKMMRELAALRGLSMGSLSDNELLLAFKDAAKNAVGDVEYRDGETFGKYMLNTIRAACENGEIDKLKENISRINISSIQQAA